MQVEDVLEPVVALIDHGSEIMMSMYFYKKGKWPISTKHGWKNTRGDTHHGGPTWCVPECTTQDVQSPRPW